MQRCYVTVNSKIKLTVMVALCDFRQLTCVMIRSIRRKNTPTGCLLRNSCEARLNNGRDGRKPLMLIDKRCAHQQIRWSFRLHLFVKDNTRWQRLCFAPCAMAKHCYVKHQPAREKLFQRCFLPARPWLNSMLVR